MPLSGSIKVTRSLHKTRPDLNVASSKIEAVTLLQLGHLAVVNAVILGHDDFDIVPFFLHSSAQRSNHIGQPAHFRNRCHFHRDMNNLQRLWGYGGAMDREMIIEAMVVVNKAAVEIRIVGEHKVHVVCIFWHLNDRTLKSNVGRNHRLQLDRTDTRRMSPMIEPHVDIDIRSTTQYRQIWTMADFDKLSSLYSGGVGVEVVPLRAPAMDSRLKLRRQSHVSNAHPHPSTDLRVRECGLWLLRQLPLHAASFLLSTHFAHRPFSFRRVDRVFRDSRLEWCNHVHCCCPTGRTCHRRIRSSSPPPLQECRSERPTNYLVHIPLPLCSSVSLPGQSLQFQYLNSIRPLDRLLWQLTYFNLLLIPIVCSQMYPDGGGSRQRPFVRVVGQ